MGFELIGLSLLAMLMAAPLLIERYLRRLPPAPACPCCHAVARVTDRTSALAWVPGFAPTFLAECVRCGWAGRMRWKWARDAARKP
jgi:hypothetical protein